MKPPALGAMLLTAICSVWSPQYDEARIRPSPGPAPLIYENYQEKSLRDTMVEIEKAASGLLIQSESDYPLQPFIWPSEEPFSLERLLKLKKYPPGTPVETLGMDQFFRHAIAEQEWHGPAEQESTRRFRALVATLKEHLRDIAVYKIGEINIGVYIIGHTRDGKYAGLSTKVVET